MLLKPGDCQIDVGLSYTIFDHNYTNLAITQSNGQAVVTPLDSRFTSRLLLMPLDIRYGVRDGLQMFADVPFGWSNTENSYPGSEAFTNVGGIGDVTAGFSWLVHKSNGCSYSPDIIATFAFTAPTANVNPLQGILEPPNTLLGQGFWFGSWNVLFVHTLDPMIFFYGFGSRHGLDREFGGYDISPGSQYTYRGGVGFAVNERVTLSASVIGSYISNPALNGQQIPGLAMEPISLRLMATVARPRYHQFWEPFVNLGMTPDAPNAQVGMTFTY